MAAVVRTEFSTALIIKALNTPGGSGGVAREMDRIRRSTIALARLSAPVNNPDDAMHRGGVTGTYKAAFKSDRKGTNGHYVRRAVFNDADHAIIVEQGRRSTRKDLSLLHYLRLRSWIRRTGGVPRGWERYSSVHTGGVIVTSPGTRGRDGQHTLERAFDEAIRRSKVHIGAVGLIRGPSRIGR
jgi:hypothetical protein